MEAADWTPERITRATEEYFDTLDDAAFGDATPVKPKVLSPVDPAARFTGAKKAYSIFAYSTNYLVDLDNAVIVDVETTAPIRQAEVNAERLLRFRRLTPAQLRRVDDACLDNLEIYESFGCPPLIAQLYEKHRYTPTNLPPGWEEHMGVTKGT